MAVQLDSTGKVRVGRGVGVRAQRVGIRGVRRGKIRSSLMEVSSDFGARRGGGLT